MLLLRAHCTGFSPADYALVTLTVPLARRIVARMDTAYDLQKRDNDFFQVEYWAWGEVRWVESNEYLEALDGKWAIKIDDTIEVEVDCRTMRVEPDSVLWIACIKLNGEFVETSPLSRLDIEEWLDEQA